MNLEWSFQKLTTKLYLNKDDNTDNFFLIPFIGFI